MDYTKILTLLSAFGIMLSSLAYDEEERYFADRMMQLTEMDKQEFESTHVEWKMPKAIRFEGESYTLVEYKWCVAKYLNVEMNKELSFCLEIENASSPRELLYGLFLSMAYSSMPGTVEEKSARMQIQVLDKHTIIIPTRRGSAAHLFYNDIGLYVSRITNARDVAKALLEAGLEEAKKQEGKMK